MQLCLPQYGGSLPNGATDNDLAGTAALHAVAQNKAQQITTAQQTIPNPELTSLMVRFRAFREQTKQTLNDLHYAGGDTVPNQFIRTCHDYMLEAFGCTGRLDEAKAIQRSGEDLLTLVHELYRPVAGVQGERLSAFPRALRELWKQHD